MFQVTFPPNFDGWQRAADRALRESVAPRHVAWTELDDDPLHLAIYEEERKANSAADAVSHVPALFPELARHAAAHRDTGRWALLYRVLWRLTHGEPQLLEIRIDPDLHELLRMDNAVRHDMHKMRAFLRFHPVEHEGETWQVAWFEPEHHIVELDAPYYVTRFAGAGTSWSILTPDRCGHWDGARLSFRRGVPRLESHNERDVEALWIHECAGALHSHAA